MKKKILFIILVIAILILASGVYLKYKDVTSEEPIDLEETYKVENETALKEKYTTLEEPIELNGEKETNQTKHTFKTIAFSLDKNYKIDEEENTYYLNLRKDSTYDSKVVLSDSFEYAKQIAEMNGSDIGIEKDIDIQDIFDQNNIVTNEDLFYAAIEEASKSENDLTTKEDYEYHYLMLQVFNIVVPNIEFQLIDSPFKGYYMYSEENTSAYELHIFANDEEYVLTLWNGDEKVFTADNIKDVYNTVSVIE